MRVILLGRPGSGKTTQAKLLSEELDLKHLSTGKMFAEYFEAPEDFRAYTKKLLVVLC